MKKTFLIIAIIFLIFIIGGLGGLFFDYLIFSRVMAHPVWSQNPLVKALDNRVRVIKNTEKVVVAESESIADIASRTASSVVYIESTNANKTMVNGNGIVVSSDGVIATTDVVVPPNSTVQYVKLADNSVYDVTAVYHDPYSRIVFLRIDANDLATIPFANSDDARSGKRLISIARSRAGDETHFALGGFLAHDYLFSIMAPKSDYLQGVLNIDFSPTVLSQSVGSPIIDFHGDMIGLISFKQEPETNTKDFYAIGANDVYNAFDEFLRAENETATREHVALGVDYHMITSLDAHVKNMDVTSGALIDMPQTYAARKVFAQSLAARSGLLGGDIVMLVNNDVVDVKNNLARLMYAHSDDERIELKVMRGDEIITVMVKK